MHVHVCAGVWCMRDMIPGLGNFERQMLTVGGSSLTYRLAVCGRETGVM